jgi:hypothetical protein
MNYLDLVNETILTAFKEGQRPRVEKWVNYAWQKVWDAGDWPFKYAIDEALAVTADTAYPTPSVTDFNRPVAINTSDGGRLTYLAPRDWDDNYGDADASSGAPEHYTLVNRRIYFGPTPDETQTWSMRYERSLAHYDADEVTVVAGPMADSGDLPMIDAGHHYILVFGACATGLHLENDPTWEQFELEFRQGLSAMQNHYLPPRFEPVSFGGGAD